MQAQMKEDVITTYSASETRTLGERMGREAKPGAVYALCGDLGAGKTVFAQGFAEGLGVGAHVTSPTFTLLQVYEEGKLPLYHFDLYRIETVDEAIDIGCEEYFHGAGVSLVEWAERAEELLPADTVRICITRDDKEESVRHVTVGN